MNELDNLRILVIDDHDDTQKLLRACFDRWGVRGDFAAGDREALPLLLREASGDHPYDLALIANAAGSRVDSLTFARLIKSSEKLAALRLLLISYSATKTADSAAAGFSGILSIPLGPSELYDKIETSLNSAALQQPTVHELTKQPLNKTEHRDRVILVVEDNAVNQKLAIMQLQKMGYSALGAGNGQQAVDAVVGGNFGLILMDCHMPIMDGFEATRLIRQTEAATSRHLPIIAMTASAMRGDREACLAAGMDDYLAKPVRSDQIYAMLERWLKDEPGEKTAKVENVSQDDSSAPEPLNPDALQALRDLTYEGEPDTLKQLVEIFFETVPPLLDKMRAALVERDADALLAASHQLASSSAYLGATRFAKIAKEIELLCLNQPHTITDLHTASLVGQLAEEYTSHLVPALTAEIARKPLDKSAPV